MANSFNKQETVLFDEMILGFDDLLVLSRNVSKFSTDDATMERSNNTIWRPQPYIAQSHDGTDATGYFDSATQLSVPATLGYQKFSTALLSAAELRDKLREGNLMTAAKQKLAADINVAIMTVAANQGTLFVKRSAAAAGFDDVAAADTVMNEQGVNAFDRFMALCSRDYNAMASNLAVATRSFGNSKSEKAYERAYVGMVASFDTYKLDYARRLTAAAGGAGLTMSTLDGGGNYYTPVATRVGTAGEMSNVDNRYQTITLSSTTSVAAGDAFTCAALNSVHHINKTDTGNLKTFRIISVDSATTATISPPMITGQGGTAAELAYQNCVINTKASNSAIVFLNTVTAPVNPFWQKDALEILPGRYAVPTDAGAAVMRGTTENGIEVVMSKQFDINTLMTKFRWDIFFGVCCKQPEMCGIELFSQS